MGSRLSSGAATGGGTATGRAVFAGAAGKRVVLSQGDLTAFRGDALVNAANELMLGGGGVDGAIHRAAGPGLLRECEAVPEVRPGVRCPTGEAVLTGGHGLSTKHVIHTVGPIYRKHEACDDPEPTPAAGPAELLRSCYQNCMRVANAEATQARTIAFPAISCGVYGYPIDEAARIALSTVQEHMGGVAEVHFVLFGASTYATWLAEARDVDGLQEEGDAAP